MSQPAGRSAPGSGGTVFAIHQPNYVPWMGFFSKLANSDVFVILDTVQYPRGQSFAARNRIKTANGPTFLTVPVSVPKGNEGRASYLDVRLADHKWRKKHLKSLELSYRKAPHFESVMDLYQPASDGHDTLVELNLSLISAVAAHLGIDTRLVRLSDLLDDFGAKSQLIADIAGALGATHYLSGTGGGQDYNDEALLADHGVELAYSSFTPGEYPQLWGEFESHLSVLDALFNCGPATAEMLEADVSRAG